MSEDCGYRPALIDKPRGRLSGEGIVKRRVKDEQWLFIVYGLPFRGVLCLRIVVTVRLR